MQEDIWKLIITVCSGVLVFVFSQLFVEFSLRPIQEYKKLKAKVAQSLILHAQYYANPRISTDENPIDAWKKASNDIRELAAEVAAFAEIKPKFIWITRSIPSKCNLNEAAGYLIGLSNSFILSPNEDISGRYAVELSKKVKYFMNIEGNNAMTNSAQNKSVKIESYFLLAISIFITTYIANCFLGNEKSNNLTTIIDVLRIIAAFFLGRSMRNVIDKYEWAKNFAWSISIAILLSTIIPSLPAFHEAFVVTIILVGVATIYYLLLAVRDVTVYFISCKDKFSGLSLEVASLVVDAVGMAIAAEPFISKVIISFTE